MASLSIIIKHWLKDKSREVGISEKAVIFLVIVAGIILLAAAFMTGYLLGRDFTVIPIIIEHNGRAAGL